MLVLPAPPVTKSDHWDEAKSPSTFQRTAGPHHRFSLLEIFARRPASKSSTIPSVSCSFDVCEWAEDLRIVAYAVTNPAFTGSYTSPCIFFPVQWLWTNRIPQTASEPLSAGTSWYPTHSSHRKESTGQYCRGVWAIMPRVSCKHQTEVSEAFNRTSCSRPPQVAWGAISPALIARASTYYLSCFNLINLFSSLLLLPNRSWRCSTATWALSRCSDIISADGAGCLARPIPAP